MPRRPCLSLAIMLVTVLATGLATVLAIGLTCGSAWAAPGDKELLEGIKLAKSGKCEQAVPLLEEAEANRSRPVSQLVLAVCLAKTGKRVEAYEMVSELATMPEDASWGQVDKKAWQKAPAVLEKLEAKVPTIQLEPEDDYPNWKVKIGSRNVKNPDAPVPVEPGEMRVVSTADGYERWKRNVVLEEGERLLLSIKMIPEKPLEPGPDEFPDDDDDDDDDDAPSEDTEMWFGMRARGMVIPKFLMNAVGDGGRDVFAPGGDLALRFVTASPELTLSLGYAYYGMPETPFKPSDGPDTDWEIIESDLSTLRLALDIMWSWALDDAEVVRFRFGGSVGLGVAFIGDINRTQAYPTGDPGDPDSYQKCIGPDNPRGTYAFCNQLDKDFDHYDGYAEPSWFEGGARPLVYPWAVFPQMAFEFRASEDVAIEIEGGWSLSGFLTGIGVHFGL